MPCGKAPSKRVLSYSCGMMIVVDLINMRNARRKIVLKNTLALFVLTSFYVTPNIFFTKKINYMRKLLNILMCK